MLMSRNDGETALSLHGSSYMAGRMRELLAIPCYSANFDVGDCKVSSIE